MRIIYPFACNSAPTSENTFPWGQTESGTDETIASTLQEHWSRACEQAARAILHVGLLTTLAWSKPGPAPGSRRQPSSKPGCVPHGEAADHSIESWQASKPWLSFPAPNCCHRCPDFIMEMSLDACKNSWKWGAAASLIGSSTGHGCVKRSKREERELFSEAAATNETVKIIKRFPSLPSPLKKLRSMLQDYHKTASGCSLWTELGRPSTHYTDVVCSWGKMRHPELKVASDIGTPSGRNALPKSQLQPEGNP